MEEFIYTRLERVTLARKVLKKDAANTNRGIVASLNWVSRESRPDASAAASIIASSFPVPNVSLVLAASEMVRHLKNVSNCFEDPCH